MQYKNVVDLSAYGVPANPIIYELSLLLKDSDDGVPDARLNDVVEKLPARPPMATMIDIERWSLLTQDDARRFEHIGKLLAVLARLRGLRPNMKFGFYGIAPQRIYWPLIDESQTKERREWDISNEKAKVDFTPYVDAIFPSLYTLYDDEKGWVKYAREMLLASRKFGKPVYCVLWPQYHLSNALLKGRYLPISYWRTELETCRMFANGIVIWNYEPEKLWDSNADWWRETVNFLRANQTRGTNRGGS